MRGDDHRWLREAVELARRCPPTVTAYAVGAIVVAADGTELARGHSRETDPRVHAEEVALARLAGRSLDLGAATLYSSLEPCSSRRSRPRTCTDLIIAAGIGRVVFALREPPVLAHCEGAELLRDAGIEVVEIPALGPGVREVNHHLTG
ncbi:deaminase [Micromonospora sp. NPDC049799]|uniref:deaminase n=1 Tax=Micromonospora sp. NPDC049799 TaxID=3154741 RepID=UPI0033ED42F6